MLARILFITTLVGSALLAPTTVKLTSDSNPVTYNINYDFNTSQFNQTGQATMFVTLNLINYNVTSWTSATANNGLWVSVAYNTTTMYNTNYTSCRYIFTNKTTDAFACSDVTFNGSAFNLNSP